MSEVLLEKLKENREAALGKLPRENMSLELQNTLLTKPGGIRTYVNINSMSNGKLNDTAYNNTMVTFWQPFLATPHEGNCDILGPYIKKEIELLNIKDIKDINKKLEDLFAGFTSKRREKCKKIINGTQSISEAATATASSSSSSSSDPGFGPSGSGSSSSSSSRRAPTGSSTNSSSSSNSSASPLNSELTGEGLITVNNKSTKDHQNKFLGEFKDMPDGIVAKLKNDSGEFTYVNKSKEAKLKELYSKYITKSSSKGESLTNVLQEFIGAGGGGLEAFRRFIEYKEDYKLLQHIINECKTSHELKNAERKRNEEEENKKVFDESPAGKFKAVEDFITDNGNNRKVALYTKKSESEEYIPFNGSSSSSSSSSNPIIIYIKKPAPPTNKSINSDDLGGTTFLLALPTRSKYVFPASSSAYSNKIMLRDRNPSAAEGEPKTINEILDENKDGLYIVTAKEVSYAYPLTPLKELTIYPQTMSGAINNFNQGLYLKNIETLLGASATHSTELLTDFVRNDMFDEYTRPDMLNTVEFREIYAQLKQEDIEEAKRAAEEETYVSMEDLLIRALLTGDPAIMSIVKTFQHKLVLNDLPHDFLEIAKPLVEQTKAHLDTLKGANPEYNDILGYIEYLKTNRIIADGLPSQHALEAEVFKLSGEFVTSLLDWDKARAERIFHGTNGKPLIFSKLTSIATGSLKDPIARDIFIRTIQQAGLSGACIVNEACDRVVTKEVGDDILGVVGRGITGDVQEAADGAAAGYTSAEHLLALKNIAGGNNLSSNSSSNSSSSSTNSEPITTALQTRHQVKVFGLVPSLGGVDKDVSWKGNLKEPTSYASILAECVYPSEVEFLRSLKVTYPGGYVTTLGLPGTFTVFYKDMTVTSPVVKVYTYIGTTQVSIGENTTISVDGIKIFCEMTNGPNGRTLFDELGVPTIKGRGSTNPSGKPQIEFNARTTANQQLIALYNGKPLCDPLKTIPNRLTICSSLDKLCVFIKTILGAVLGSVNVKENYELYAMAPLPKTANTIPINLAGIKLLELYGPTIYSNIKPQANKLKELLGRLSNAPNFMDITHLQGGEFVAARLALQQLPPDFPVTLQYLKDPKMFTGVNEAIEDTFKITETVATFKNIINDMAEIINQLITEKPLSRCRPPEVITHFKGQTKQLYNLYRLIQSSRPATELIIGQELGIILQYGTNKGGNHIPNPEDLVEDYINYVTTSQENNATIESDISIYDLERLNNILNESHKYMTGVALTGNSIFPASMQPLASSGFNAPGDNYEIPHQEPTTFQKSIRNFTKPDNLFTWIVTEGVLSYIGKDEKNPIKIDFNENGQKGTIQLKYGTGIDQTTHPDATVESFSFPNKPGEAHFRGGHRPSKKSKRSKKNGTKLARLLSRKLKRSHLHRSHRRQRSPTQTTQRTTQRRRPSHK